MRSFPGVRHRAIWRFVPILLVLLAACDTVAVPPSSTGDTGGPGAGPPAGSDVTLAPTPLPAPELLARALRRRTIGDYDGMAQELRTLLDAHPDASEARPAGFHLAESDALSGRWTSAVAALRGFVERGPQDDLYT